MSNFGYQISGFGSYPQRLIMSYLVIAGGGGGGYEDGGGGGAGGYRNSFNNEMSGGGNTGGETPLTLDKGTQYTVCNYYFCWWWCWCARKCWC